MIINPPLLPRQPHHAHYCRLALQPLLFRSFAAVPRLQQFIHCHSSIFSALSEGVQPPANVMMHSRLNALYHSYNTGRPAARRFQVLQSFLLTAVGLGVMRNLKRGGGERLDQRVHRRTSDPAPAPFPHRCCCCCGGGAPRAGEPLARRAADGFRPQLLGHC